MKRLWYKIPRDLRDVLAYVYFASAFFVFPWFLGAIWRQEQYFWIGDEWTYHPLRNIGIGNKLLGIYMYLVFYIGWFLIGYIIYDWGKNSTQNKIKKLEGDVKILSDKLASEQEKSSQTTQSRIQKIVPQPGEAYQILGMSKPQSPKEEAFVTLRFKPKQTPNHQPQSSPKESPKKPEWVYTGYKKYQTVVDWWEKEGRGKFPIQAPAAISKLQKERGVSFHEAYEYLVEKKVLIPTGYVEQE